MIYKNLYEYCTQINLLSSLLADAKIKADASTTF